MNVTLQQLSDEQFENHCIAVIREFERRNECTITDVTQEKPMSDVELEMSNRMMGHRGTIKRQPSYLKIDFK